jgi:hypothetical protein
MGKERDDQKWKAIRRDALGSAADPAEQFGKMGRWGQIARVSAPAAISTEEKAFSSGRNLPISNRWGNVNVYFI